MIAHVEPIGLVGPANPAVSRQRQASSPARNEFSASCRPASGWPASSVWTHEITRAVPAIRIAAQRRRQSEAARNRRLDPQPLAVLLGVGVDTLDQGVDAAMTFVQPPGANIARKSRSVLRSSPAGASAASDPAPAVKGSCLPLTGMMRSRLAPPPAPRSRGGLWPCCNNRPSTGRSG